MTVEILEKRTLMSDVSLTRIGGFDHGNYAEGARRDHRV